MGYDDDPFLTRADAEALMTETRWNTCPRCGAKRVLEALGGETYIGSEGPFTQWVVRCTENGDESDHGLGFPGHGPYEEAKKRHWWSR